MATTPNMSLVLPTVSQTLGPLWATEVNAAISLVDSHNHAAGQGVQVPTVGINVNADLPFGGFNAVGLRTARFTSQAATLTQPADAGCAYVVAGDLWYNNGSGAAVQITSGAAIVGTPGSIGGLASPAAVTYTSVDTRFRFTSNASVNAQLDAGPVTVRSMVASANGVTIQSPSGLAANYAVTLWPSLPASQRVVTLDNLGVLSTSALNPVDGVTIVLASGLYQAVGVTQSGANATATVRGNRSAADTGADVVLTGQATRTAGKLTDFQNNGVSQAYLDFAGQLWLVNAAPAIVDGAGNTSLTLFGNRNAADAGADLVLTGRATRTAGVLADFQNNGASRAQVDYIGNVHGSNLSQYAFQNSDLSFGTSATTSSLGFTSVTGGAYEFDAELLVSAGGGLTVNMTFGVSGLVASTFTVASMTVSSDGNNTPNGAASTALATGLALLTVTTGGVVQLVRVHGYLVASTGGLMTLRFAGIASTSVLKAGSSFRWRRVDLGTYA